MTRKVLLGITLLLTISTLSSCVTKRTTRQGNEIVDEKYIIHRPVKKFIQNAEFE